jgi:hypothetical protein
MTDKRLALKHPIQPVADDGTGILRFKPNAIVGYLLDAGPFDLNTLTAMHFPAEDWEQFAQLIGYSLSGAGDLSYMTNETWEAAEKMSKGADEKDARIAYLEETIATVRQAVKILAPAVFRMHPDDLEV